MNSLKLPTIEMNGSLGLSAGPSGHKIDEDCEMTEACNEPPLCVGSNSRLSTTILYSPLHIDAENANLAFRSKSPTLQVQSSDGPVQEQTERSVFCRTPPLICEQGPSAPSSPTSPGGRRKPNSLHVDALQRLDLLSPNFVPSMDFSKLSPLSPSYPTSDLGSSPRSSISMTQSGLGPHWTTFRDFKKSSSDYDGDSDICAKDLLSPGTILSPAPFSPFSDCCTESETPYSQRSPNMSPMPSTRHLHFSFDQIRSRSSMSNRADGGTDTNFLMPQMSLDIDTRERSRSEGEMNHSEDMDTTINHSTISVPVTSNRHAQPGQYRKRLLQKCRNDSDKNKYFHSSDSVTTDASGGKVGLSAVSSTDQEDGDLMNQSVSTQVSRQPTIEEPPPEPTIEELYRNNRHMLERQQQVQGWIKEQAEAWEMLKSYLTPLQTQQPPDNSNLLQVPGSNGINTSFLSAPQSNELRHIAQIIAEGTAQQRQAAFRRSRSETDVSQAQEQSFVCEHCGQAFAMHDRLAKHIASRHRDRSASVNDENSKTHKCTLCPKSFGRSDMLTRHMRLHTGVKPYSCLICGQVFSRSDHLSTHQRTHTGEKPYRCPQCCYSASRRDMITRHMRTHVRPDGSPLPPGAELALPIGQLSLNSRSPLLTPEPLPNNLPPVFPAVSSNPSTSTSPNIFAGPTLQSQTSLPVPKLSTHPTSIPNDNNTDAAVFAAAANVATLSNLYNSAQQQLKLAQMSRSADATLPPDFLRNSTPNLPGLLGAPERPSAFRPPTPTALTPQTSTSDLAAAAAALAQNLNPFNFPNPTTAPSTCTANTNLLNATLAAAAAALQSQQQAAAQMNLLTPPGLSLTHSASTSDLTASSLGASVTSGGANGGGSAGGNPLLARQSSIGGFGFS